MAKWEYAVIPLKSDNRSDRTDKNTLDTYGAEGWELINIVKIGLQLIAYFKREKR